MTSLDLSTIVIHLMKGVLYQDKQPQLWNTLLNIQIAVRDYVTIVGLELIIDETEGFAFLRQCEFTDEGTTAALPRLIQRRQLSYSVSLLCILLRKKLIENDSAGESTRVILTHQQIINMMTVFLPDKTNEVKTIEQIETCINKIIDFGFLRRLKKDATHYEVQRIIKALINADWLNNIDAKLQEYLEHAQTNTN